jgi:antitoxin VapB
MARTAKLFRNGRSQAVRLPSDYRFEGSEVYVRRDPSTGDVILSRRPESWEDFFELMKNIEVPSDFLTGRDGNRRESGSSSDVPTLLAGHKHCQLYHQGQYSSGS